VLVVQFDRRVSNGRVLKKNRPLCSKFIPDLDPRPRDFFAPTIRGLFIVGWRHEGPLLLVKICIATSSAFAWQYASIARVHLDPNGCNAEIV
jgi:hypothetical protein